MKNFLLMDDHEVVRAGLRTVLNELYHPCSITEAGCEQTLLQALKQQSYHLIIMDVQIPHTDTLSLMGFIHSRYPENKVLIYSMSAEQVFARSFLKAGAMGFVCKSAGLQELQKAINLVLNNRRYISETLADQLATQMTQSGKQNPFEQLSARELMIAQELMKGTSLCEISQQLNISASTVSTYKQRLYEKLQVKTVVELIDIGKAFAL